MIAVIRSFSCLAVMKPPWQAIGSGLVHRGLAPTYREDFRESLYRLIGALTATGVTVMMTAEVIDVFPDFRFTTERVSFITDDIIVQRYVEMGGHLQTVIAVVKMRGSEHSTDFRTYHLTEQGALIGQSLDAYHGITTGVPTLLGEAGEIDPDG